MARPMPVRRGERVVFLEQLLELVVHGERRPAADVRRNDAALLENLLLEVDDLLHVLADVVEDRQDEVVRLDRARAVAREILVVDVEVEVVHRAARHRAHGAAVECLEHLVAGVAGEHADIVPELADQARDVLAGRLALDLVVDHVRCLVRQLREHVRRDRHARLLRRVLHHDRHRRHGLRDGERMLVDEVRAGLQEERREEHHAVGPRRLYLLREFDRVRSRVARVGDDHGHVVPVRLVDRHAHHLALLGLVELVVLARDAEERERVAAALCKRRHEVAQRIVVHRLVLRERRRHDRADSLDQIDVHFLPSCL